MKEFHVLNLGAGVQRTALYLMIMRGELDITLDCAVFSDLGEEPGSVYRHLEWLQRQDGPPIRITRRHSELTLGAALMQRRVWTVSTEPAYFVDVHGNLWKGPICVDNFNYSRCDGIGTNGRDVWLIWIAERSDPRKDWIRLPSDPTQACVMI